MVSNAFASFVEGFAGTLAVNINERKKEARDYFNKQVEYARTTGMENRKKVRATVESNMTIADQLAAVGVPKEVIMAQITMDPSSLGDMANQTEKLRASAGREFSAEEWKAIYEVAADYKAPNEDMATFISRTYDPIANAAQSPGFEEDPKGSLISSMMGFSSMDEARDRLKTTDIGGGLTADQLMRYGDSTPQRVGPRTTVTTNYGAVEKMAGDKGLTIPETAAVIKMTDEIADRVVVGDKDNQDAEQGTKNGLFILDTVKDQIRELNLPGVTEAVIDVQARRAIRQRGYIFPEEDVVTEDPVAPTGGGTDTQPVPETTTPTTEVVTAPVEPPVDDPMSAPIDIEKEPHLRVIPDIILRGKMRTLTFTSDNGDGTSLWIDQDGEEVKMKNAGLRARSQ